MPAGSKRSFRRRCRLAVAGGKRLSPAGVGIPQDIQQDPASCVIIALLAPQMGMGINDSVPRQATEEIHRVRN